MKENRNLMKEMRILRKIPLALPCLLLVLSACSQIDCPLNNRVYATYQFCNSAGDSVTLADTLTVSTTRINGQDSVLLNRQVNTISFSIPLSYSLPEDILYVEVRGSNFHFIDTLRIAKEDRPHFESVDCNPAFFHTLQGVMTTHHAIDSITIINKTVDYDTSKKHFHIYLRANN